MPRTAIRRPRLGRTPGARGAKNPTFNLFDSRAPLSPAGWLRDNEIIVDSFAGGGGASHGIFLATGRHPDAAINHDDEAIALHAANHPTTYHYPRSVWEVDPREVVARFGGRPVGLLWLSPDCKHFSKAKGGAPVSPRVRGLAWVAVYWAEKVAPRIICLENVEEFQTWGPLDKATGRPCPARKGRTFRRFVGRLRRLGYEVDWRELRASEYGTPTSRKRLFLVARRDGEPIVWPAPTHGPAGSGLLPFRTAAECIDWTIPCPSIFLSREEARRVGRAIGRRIKRPLVPNTMQRIARGVDRYVLKNPRPFIVTLRGTEPAHIETSAQSTDEPLRTVSGSGTHHALIAPSLVQIQNASNANGTAPLDRPMPTVTAYPKGGGFAIVAPYLVPRYGEREGQAPRCAPADAPMPTVVPTQNGAQLVAAFMAQHNTDVVGHHMTEPVSTIVGKGCTQALVLAALGAPEAPVVGDRREQVAAFLAAYYGNEKDGQALDVPMRTVSTRDRFCLVTVRGLDLIIVDIGQRMLLPRELFRAQGFPDDYIIDVLFNGELLGPEAQVRMCGNSVAPQMAAAIVGANCMPAAPVDVRRAA